MHGFDGTPETPSDEDGLRIAVVGAGYVGLVSSACLAELGHEVLCVDSCARKLEILRAGGCPIYEPGLTAMVARNRAAGRLAFGSTLPPLQGVRAVFLAVGTPPRPEGGADLTALFEAVAEMAPKLGRHTVVVLKSTVPPGVGDAVQRRLERLRPDLRITVVSNPEFLREGAAIEDFMKPDRIVVGAASAYGRWVMERVYAPLMAQGAPMLVTRRRSAELVKYASNAFLATKISFINEMADLCEALGGDVEDVARGMGLDRRIGADFLQAGPGYGGSCFPKDTLALLAAAADYRVELRVVSGVVEANRVRVSRLSARVAEALGGDLRGRRVAVLGLTFKPHTDDLRDSPAVALAAQLAADGARVTAYDPQGSGPGAERLGGVELAPDAYACLEGAEAAVLATHWPEFADLDFARAGELMAERLWIDLRNAAPTEALVAAGFTVRPLGRPLAAPDADADPPHDAVPHPASLGAWTPSPSRSNPREIA